jgi:hypothetical protein
MRSGLHHYVGTLAEQASGICDEGDAVFRSQRTAARLAAAARNRHHFDFTQRAAANMLDKQARDGAAADDAYAHR